MKVTSATFLAAAGDPRHLPRPHGPEIAFAGRSNVGKSSLLNRLVGQHKLARVSKTPGRTQQINFFVLNDALVFVDLPGYGFARVPPAVKARWRHLVESYLTGRHTVRAVVVLIDSRRGLQPDDRQLLDFLHGHDISPIVVATKADKLTRSEQAKQLAALRAAGRFEPCMVSAHTGSGIDQLWTVIERHLRS
ncbi:MAG TPA: ribosome biogenesis GTP-binding protein YihA/YsxC [Candidatus Binatia bacterium]|nr:ribosome biogenesis GTP-binding protein YihA/YsxC [Candidatus Binatia bacterium]